MFNNVKLLILLSTVFLIVSCGGGEELKLDCSSPQSYAESTTKMVKKLSESGNNEDGQAFSMGMLKISLEFNQSGNDINVLKKYHGWTAKQVIEHGKKK